MRRFSNIQDALNRNRALSEDGVVSGLREAREAG
jgi:hypothetical protein